MIIKKEEFKEPKTEKELESERFDKRKYNCYHYSGSSGYGTHSRCRIYGLFKCGDCRYWTDKNDKVKVNSWKIREELGYMSESLDEIEGETKKIRESMARIRDYYLPKMDDEYERTSKD